MLPQRPFKLERFFAEYEFNTPHLLSASDCQTMALQDLLALADADGLERWESLTLGYTESSGHPVLRREIASLYAAIQPDQVQVVAPVEGIFLAMHALLRAGDHVVVLQPAYQSLYEVAHAIGCQVSPWALRMSDCGWVLDTDELETLVRPETRLLVINLPHNPTGYHATSDVLRRILAIARRHQAYVLSDEMYRFIEYTPEARLPAVCDIYERGISLSGMSKALGLPGLRIGWLATQDEGAASRWRTLRDYTTLCSSGPAEVLAIIGLRARDEILKRTLGTVLSNLALANETLTRWPHLFRWLPPMAGSVAFPHWTSMTSLASFYESLREAGVLMAGGHLFEHPGNFRVGLGRSDFAVTLRIVSRVCESIT